MKKLLLTIILFFGSNAYTVEINDDLVTVKVPEYYGTPKLEKTETKRYWRFVSDTASLAVIAHSCSPCSTFDQESIDLANRVEVMKDYGSILFEKDGYKGWINHGPSKTGPMRQSRKFPVTMSLLVFNC